MKGFVIGFLVAALLVGGAWFVADRVMNGGQAQEKKAATKYHCPMHPTIYYDKPGDCPICGMKLVPVDDSTQAPQGETAMPMGPEETSPEGYAPVNVSPDKLQLMGVATTEVREADLDQSIRTTGLVVPDETRLHHVHTKFEGFIDQIFVDFTGQYVRQGDPLFSIYSPELLATQREFLLALKAKETLEPGGAGGSDIDFVESARRRLELWDIGPDQIAKLEKERQPIKSLIVRSPVSGYVTAKTAVQGTRVMPSDSLYDIVDLSRVWVIADIYEVNLPFVNVGTPVTVQLPYETDRVVEGRVAYLDPVLDPATRTLKARVEVPNPGNTMKPGMYATVILQGVRAKGLVVPESAVLATGERMIVFVEKGEGRFQPREVTTGVKVRGSYEVKSGLSAGEKVVISGNFLLDSESRLRAAVSGTGQHEH